MNLPKKHPCSPHTYLDNINSSGIAMYLSVNWDEGPTKHGAFFTFNNVTGPAKLIVGPEGHCGWLAVEKNTGFDITIEERRFFDYWLKGIDNGIMDEDRVYYYTYNAPGRIYENVDTIITEEINLFNRERYNQLTSE